MTDVTRNALGQHWFERYELLTQYKLEKGHCNVDFKEIVLGKWVRTQRTMYHLRMLGRPSKMTARRVHELNKIGFDWSAHVNKNKWQERFAQLVSFKETYGHCNVPRTCAEHLFKGMGTWVNEQRKEFKKGRLKGDRIEKLEALGFEFARVTPRIQKLGAPVASNEVEKYIHYLPAQANNIDIASGAINELERELGVPVGSGSNDEEVCKYPARAQVSDVEIADEAIKELERELTRKNEAIAKHKEQINQRDKEIKKLTNAVTKKLARRDTMIKTLSHDLISVNKKHYTAMQQLKEDLAAKLARKVRDVQTSSEDCNSKLAKKDEEIQKLTLELASARSQGGESSGTQINVQHQHQLEEYHTY